VWLAERFSSITASANRLFRAFFFPMIATMVVLELAQIPLAVSLARKIRRGRREREELLQRAIEASEFGRRRIARDLHDGISPASLTRSARPWQRRGMSIPSRQERLSRRLGRRAREHPRAAHAAGRHLSAAIAHEDDPATQVVILTSFSERDEILTALDA
jgi:hypothetical protein